LPRYAVINTFKRRDGMPQRIAERRLTFLRIMNGRIFDIEEFAVYDGPGIRTVVFFKGCPLRCQWCHNPEGLDFAPTRVTQLRLCEQCGACENACPNKGGVCTACGACENACPQQLPIREKLAEIAEMMK